MRRANIFAASAAFAMIIGAGHEARRGAFAEEAQQRNEVGQSVTRAKADAAHLKQLWSEGWELFTDGLYKLALHKKREEFDAVCEAYPEGAWQRSLTAAELDDFRQAAALDANDRAQLSGAIRNYLQQIALLRQHERVEAIQAGESALAAFTELLGEDSALAVRTMGPLINVCMVEDERRAKDLIARTLRTCERTRVPQDPEWISARLIVAGWDLRHADRFWTAGPELKRLLVDCPPESKFVTWRASALNHLSCYYLLLGDSATALNYLAEFRDAVADANRLEGWQTIQSRIHHVLCLLDAGDKRRASQECAELDQIMASLAEDPRNARQIWQLARAGVMVRLGRHQEAEESLNKVKAAPNGGKDGLTRARIRIVEGEAALGLGDFRKAEQALEAGINEHVVLREGDHPCILEPLKHLIDIKRQLGKTQEASQLKTRLSRLAAKIAEARR